VSSTETVSQNTNPEKWAAKLSLMVGLVLLIMKFYAFYITKSEAIFSDAMESIVNVVAAAMALSVIVYSLKPRDVDHPYGHGKAEYFSSAFEGGLIIFAAVMILLKAVEALFNPHEVYRLGLGVVIVGVAGGANFVAGLFLLKSGKKNQSNVLVASGHHLISDFYTSLGVIIGLLLVRATGYSWLDPVVAIIVSAQLGYTGIKIVKNSFSGLMDAEDLKVLSELVKVFNKNATQGIIQIHHTKIIRAGKYHHIDAHIVVPEFWQIQQVHDEVLGFERRVLSEYSYEGEMNYHLDPCRRVYCSVCDLKDCAVRQAQFIEKRPVDIEDLRSKFEPEGYRDPNLFD